MGELFTFEELKDDIDYIQHKNNDNLCKVLREKGSNGSLEFYPTWKTIDEYRNPEKYCPDEERCEWLTGFVTSKYHYHCVCSEAILYPFIIQNQENYNMLVIGSKCIHKFGSEAKDELKKIKYKYSDRQGCYTCFHTKKDYKEITVNKSIVQRQQGCEKIYHIKCLNILFKKCKKCKEYKKHNCKCDNINTIETEPPPYETITPPAPPETSINLNTIVKFGKYKGKQISELIKDLNYCKWIKCEDYTTGQFKQIQEYLQLPDCEQCNDTGRGYLGGGCYGKCPFC